MLQLFNHTYHRAGAFVHHRHYRSVAETVPPTHAHDVPQAFSEDLEAWFAQACVGALNRAVQCTDWKAVARRPHGKRRIYETLTADRLSDLTLESRAHLAAAWIGLRARHTGGPVCAILRSSVGAALSRIKEAIDSGSEDGLTDFVWRQHGVRRSAVLEHIKKQAVRQAQVYVFSDIDNTWTPSRDKQYAPSQACYPGARSLYAAIVGGPANFDRNVIFLSARPGTPKLGFRRLSKHVSEATYAMLHGMGNGCHVIFGDFWHCIPRPWFHPLALLGVKKAESFRRWVAVHPEYRYAFFGDSGEADIQAGVTMMRQNPDNITHVFIHDLGNVVPKRRQAYAKMGVWFYQSTAGAALGAWQHELIDAPQLRAIDALTCADFAKLKFPTPALRIARLKELQRELAMGPGRLRAAA